MQIITMTHRPKPWAEAMAMGPGAEVKGNGGEGLPCPSAVPSGCIKLLALSQAKAGSNFEHKFGQGQVIPTFFSTLGVAPLLNFCP